MSLHLLLGVGVGDLEVAQVVEEPADLLVEAVVAVVDPAADLALDDLGVLEVVACGLGSRSVLARVRTASSTGVMACFCMARIRAISSRISRRASSSWRAASSLETIRSRISRLLPRFGPLIASKSRASAWKVMIEPAASFSGARSQS